MTKALPYYAKTLLNLAKDFFLFPIWWYYFGFKKFLIQTKTFLSNRQKSWAFFVWLRNLFVPMYGQYDLSGRIISFFVRLFQVLVRGVIMIFWTIFSLFLILLWLFLPIYIVYQIIFQLI